MASLFSGRSGRLAAQDQYAQVFAAKKAAQGEIDTGLQNATGNYQSALSQYADFGGRASAGADAYGDAVGINGQQGQQRAYQNFSSNPGYQFAQNQALDQLDRRQSSRGMLNSGATIAGSNQLIENLANQRYGDYVSRLSPYLGLDQASASNQASILQNLGNLNYQAGTNKAGIESSFGPQLGQITAGGMMAGQNAQANSWGLGLQGLKLGAQLLGLGGGMGGRQPGNIGGTGGNLGGLY